MRLLSPLGSRLGLLVVFLLAAVSLSGCGGQAHRPASALSDHDRTVLVAYEEIRAGLASDDPRTARVGAMALVAELKKNGGDHSSNPLLARSQAFLDARALDSQRQAFAPLSDSLIPLAAGVEGYYIMSSPPGLGGDWIQRTPDIDNPYLGKVMHSSGSLKK
jgi:hypothetical protein